VKVTGNWYAVSFFEEADLGVLIKAFNVNEKDRENRLHAANTVIDSL
jgi:hypothetical protein